ncbi:hypothetical protein M0802_016601 [Mischocyttarus mexicanus]|nr:hypothetical protein M0802_016601 [Mischocyttarus mexicanus]
MEENYISPILYEIFPHLKPTEPATALEYSRYWESIVLHDKKEKESFFYILDKLTVNVGLKWIFQNRNIKEHYNVTAFVGISFNNLQNEINACHGRPCSNKRFNYFVVDLKSCYDISISENSDSLLRINFPILDSPDVTILSFINQRVASKYSSNLLYLDKEDFNQALNFLSQLQNFVTQNNLLSSIVIIFCRDTYYQKFLRLNSIISFWFGLHGMTIWIAVVDEIRICRYNFGYHYCKIDTEFLYMFINNPSYKAYMKCLLPHYNTPDKIRTQLKNFRQIVGFLTGSIAFMHVSYGRMKKFYCLDTKLFREIFPATRLLPFWGKTSYYGHYFSHIPHFPMSPHTKTLFFVTTILIIARR